MLKQTKKGTGEESQNSGTITPVAWLFWKIFVDGCSLREGKVLQFSIMSKVDNGINGILANNRESS